MRASIACIIASALSCASAQANPPCKIPDELESLFSSAKIGKLQEPAPPRAGPLPVESPLERALREAYPELATRRAIAEAKKLPSHRFLSTSEPPPRVLAAARKLNALEPGSAEWGAAIEETQLEVDRYLKPYGIAANVIVGEDDVIVAAVKRPMAARKGGPWINNLAFTLGKGKPPHMLVLEITGIESRSAFYGARRRQIGLTWGSPKARAITPEVVRNLVTRNQVRVAIAEKAGQSAGSLTRQPIEVALVTPARPFDVAHSGAIAAQAEEMFGGTTGRLSGEYEGHWREAKMFQNSWRAEMKRIESLLQTSEKLTPRELERKIQGIEAWIKQHYDEAQIAKGHFEDRDQWVRALIDQDGRILDEAIARLEAGKSAGALGAGRLTLEDGSVIYLAPEDIIARHRGADLAADGDRLLGEELKRLRAHQESRLNALNQLEAEEKAYTDEALSAAMQRLHWLADAEPVSFNYIPGERSGPRVVPGDSVLVTYQTANQTSVKAYGVLLRQDKHSFRFRDQATGQEITVNVNGLSSGSQLKSLFKRRTRP
jgi:hypothetical protein